MRVQSSVAAVDREGGGRWVVCSVPGPPRVVKDPG